MGWGGEGGGEQVVTYFDDARAGFALFIHSEGGADDGDGRDTGNEVRALWVLLWVLRGKSWGSKGGRVGR